MYSDNNVHLTALCPGLPGWAGTGRCHAKSDFKRSVRTSYKI